ncbi:MAG: MarR family transcriptional regulator [Azospirillaceae bacterium]|nr:MarR family transcriptional regulator [Azospirillaceae bacterium]
MTHPQNPADTPALDKADYVLLAEFRHLLRRFLSFSEDAAAGAGLTAQQHQALLAIKGFPGRDHVTVGELAERLCVRPHSAVGLVDRLESHGLVVRRPGPGDRRQVVLSLTPAAEAVLAALSLAHRQEIRRLTPLIRPLFDQLSVQPPSQSDPSV